MVFSVYINSVCHSNQKKEEGSRQATNQKKTEAFFLID
jgi:hypothetical protein